MPEPLLPVTPLRVLLAFDSFKGSLTAAEACAAAAEALKARFGELVELREVPLADGGEGSLALLERHLNVERHTVETTDAIGRPTRASFLLDPRARVAFVEVAQAAGLPNVSDVPLQPLTASSFGVGTMVRHALHAGAEEIVLMLGGSATTDGGAGLMAALGLELLDARGERLPPGGGALHALSEVATAALMPEAAAAKWICVSDVSATLTGPEGPAFRFAPQKGANPEQTRILDRALHTARDVLERATGRRLGRAPGSGAAGGMALFPSAFAEVSFVPGGRYLAGQLGLTRLLEETDLVITGEGSFDAQSLSGKVVGTLAELAGEAGGRPPVAVVAGRVDIANSTLPDPICAALSIADGPATLDDLRLRAAQLVGARATDAVALFLAGRASR